MPSAPSLPSAHSVTVAVRVKPGASRARVGGRYEGPHGAALVVAVNAPAVDGRATEATRRALAKALAVPASTVSLRAGAASRDKVFTVTPVPDGLPGRIGALLGGAGAETGTP